jgi:hypothetical protein
MLGAINVCPTRAETKLSTLSAAAGHYCSPLSK